MMLVTIIVKKYTVRFKRF